MVLEQPLKTPFVAAVALVVNSLRPEVLEAVLARITTATEERVREGEWRDVKLYLKFLACLQSCFDGDGLFPVLDELFNRAVDLQTARSEDVSLTTLLACRLVLAHHTPLDYRDRTCQDHPTYNPLHLGCCPFATIATESRRAYGQDRHNCVGAARITGSHRSVPSREGIRKPPGQYESHQSASEAAPERGCERVALILPTDAVADAARGD